MTEQWRELKETITEMRDNGGTGTQQDVCKFLANYMETLEKQMQQPSEDCISREEILSLQTEYAEKMGATTFWKLRDDIRALPSVTPQRKRGKWIFREDMGHQYCCSECGCPKPFVNDYYYKKIIGCPYCLADMSGGGEDGEDSACG